MKTQPINLLLVEDSVSDVKSIKLMLARAKTPFRVRAVNDLATGLEYLANHIVDVILLDLTLPDSDGLKTFHAIYTVAPDIPILVLTSHENEELVMQIATAGAQEYLVKSEFNQQTLTRAIQYAIQRKHAEEQLREAKTKYQQQAQELDLLNRVISTAASGRDEKMALHNICHELALFFGSPKIIIILMDDDGYSGTVAAEYHANPQDSMMGRQIDVSGSMAIQSVLDTRLTFVVNSVDAYPPDSEIQAYLQSSHAAAMLVAPIRLYDHIIGLLEIHTVTPGSFTPDKVQLVKSVSEEIGHAIETARLYGRLHAHTTELEERVAERTRELEEANEQLKELDDLKSKFISDITHELRNPITNLSLYLDLLEVAPAYKHRQYLGNLRKQLDRVINLIADILNLARLETEQENVLHSPVDLNETIQHVVAAHAARANANSLQLTFEPETTIPFVWGEVNQLIQVITNLIDNALNYTMSGEIRIRTGVQIDAQCEYVTLVVQDTGFGIEASDLPHVFDRFYRGKYVDKENIPGTGLGLGIVKEIVETHNGRILVESQVNEGTTFTVLLPAVKNKACLKIEEE